MKKIISIFIVAFCVISVTLIPASAAQNDVSLWATYNDTTVNLIISTETLYAGIEGTIKYDSSVLTYKSVVFNSEINNKNTEIDSVKANDGKLDILLLGNVKFGTKGDWAVLTFSTNKKQKVDFSFNNITASLITGKPAECSGNKISVITNTKSGDVNGDDTIDILDLVNIKKYLNDKSKDAVVNMDVNNDKTINSTDINVVRGFILNS